MLKLSAKETVESTRRRIKGALYPPLDVISNEQAVAMNDAIIRLKFEMLRLAAKCF